ncbi:DUF6760 family protein [Streptomyces sp. UC4497]
MEEMAFLAYYLHWPYDQLMTLEHHERRRWVEQISRFNAEMNERT